MDKEEMREKIKDALEPYKKGEKPLHECMSNALVSLLGKPIEPIDDSQGTGK